ncbi:DUF1294 domain-containing protein [Massilia arenosa]|uniref:DUF1294 domain-containing protein n=1 Tax=Zemynaea arenosa TaxID=2561931 RepID=A0A4Y9S2K9_9BURK|nr:DUF1294 domain-containing protein [Massilia arenosa]TFW15719.1 DUF1294 domain-containing protein [Massilia arenosa]
MSGKHVKEVAGIALAYGVMSVLCFIVYAFDKQAAQRKGARRTPERTLLLLGFLCGWPGAVLAQHWLRHKSAKLAFLWKHWLTALANLACLAGGAWLVSGPH